MIYYLQSKDKTKKWFLKRNDGSQKNNVLSSTCQKKTTANIEFFDQGKNPSDMKVKKVIFRQIKTIEFDTTWPAQGNTK